MKAAYIENFGGPEVVQFGEIPAPSAGGGLVLIEVYAAGINRADHLIRAGASGQKLALPSTLGKDFSGVVQEVPPGLEVLVGQPVFGVCPVEQNGACAEQVAVSPQVLCPLPDSVSHVTAAALGLPALTALISIETSLDVKAGETVLIEGAAGGVGGFAVQLARKRGAQVVATAWSGNHPYVRDLGADEVIDPQEMNIAGLGPVCDAVLQTVGGDSALRAFSVLKPGGRAAFIGSGASAPASPRPDTVSLRPNVVRARLHLERIATLASAGKLRTAELRTFPLSEASEAHRYDATRHRRGRTVLEVRP